MGSDPVLIALPFHRCADMGGKNSRVQQKIVLYHLEIIKVFQLEQKVAQTSERVRGNGSTPFSEAPPWRPAVFCSDALGATIEPSWQDYDEYHVLLNSHWF